MTTSLATKAYSTEHGPASVLEYLEGFLNQSDAGLIVGETHQSIRVLRALLRSRALRQSHTAEEALSCLAEDMSTFIVIAPPLDTQLYYLLCQYSSQTKTIQVMKQRSMELSQLPIEPSKAHLLFIVAADDLKLIEAKHRVSEKVGSIERFS
jgi:hypothetical protein